MPSFLSLLKADSRMCVCVVLWENGMCSDGVDSVGSLCEWLTAYVWHGHNISASVRIVDFFKGNVMFYSRTSAFQKSVLPLLIVSVAVARLNPLVLWHFRYPITLGWRMSIPGADKSLARPISRCILFDGENISFDASLVIYINSTNIPPIMVINRIYETQNLLSL